MPGKNDSDWGRFLGIGLEIGIGALLGYAIGHWLDNRYGWGQKGTLIGMMLGLAAGMYLLIKEAMRINKD